MGMRIALAAFVASGDRVEIELRRYDDGRLSLTGECAGSAGQCTEAIEEAAGDNPDVQTVLTIWEENHLKVTPDSIFERCREALERLNGTRFGEVPDVDDAPEIGGDIMDSRDVIKRLEIYREAVRLMGVPDDKLDTMDDGENWPEELSEDLDSDDQEIVEEFLRLRALDEQGEATGGDWQFGETLIREEYFTEYAEGYAEDIGAIDRDARWPNTHIDWEAAAADLRQDYSEVKYGNETYLTRSG
jgi:hypothetical protein